MTLDEAVSKDSRIIEALAKRQKMKEWLASEDAKRAPWDVRDLIDCEANHLGNVILDTRAYTSAGLRIKAEIAAEIEERGYVAEMMVAA